MIRYVLAVILVVTIFGIAFVAIEEIEQSRGEQQVESEVRAIERAATTLMTHNDPPAPGSEGPKRVVEIGLPGDTFTSASIDILHFQPRHEYGLTEVTYGYQDRPNSTVFIEAILENSDPNRADIDLGGSDERLVLTLELVGRDTGGKPIVEVTIHSV